MTSIVDHVHAVPANGLDARLARLLAEWLPRQRWYGGKGARIDADEGVRVLARLDLLPERDPGLAMLVVEVRPDGRDPERYQLFLGARRELPDRLAHAEVGSVSDGDGGEWHCYDALHDPELAGWLLGRLVAGEVIGPLRFHLLPGHRISKGLRSLVLTGEQSNTSVIYGDKLIAKFLRRAVAGVNPDLELSLALADSGSRNIPQPVGWIDLTLDLDALAAAAAGDVAPRLAGAARAAPIQKAAAEASASGANTAVGANQAGMIIWLITAMYSQLDVSPCMAGGTHHQAPRASAAATAVSRLASRQPGGDGRQPCSPPRPSGPGGSPRPPGWDHHSRVATAAAHSTATAGPASRSGRAVKKECQMTTWMTM